MKPTGFNPQLRDIVVDEIFPHTPEIIWKALTTGALIARWLMEAKGFEAVKGNRFTYQTKPGGEWDGVIHCEVIEVVPNERLAYRWKGGHEANAGYGSKLDTVVTWSLSRVGKGTRLSLVHSGFVTPNNDSAFKTMGEGWPKVVHELGEIATTLH
ncbi:SRPBCC domain-containing protein [Oxalobacteraceae bacterium]|nr:SRPBCC domain-containing protein [Oxalobacteraceae bacterium]